MRIRLTTLLTLILSTGLSAQTGTMFVQGDKVGVGTASPSTELHVQGNDSANNLTKVLVENTNGSAVAREMFELNNNGLVAFIFEDRSVPERWAFSASSALNFNNQARTGIELVLDPIGNLTLAGNLIQNSDRETKTDITPVDPASVLAMIEGLPISQWRRIGDNALHLGPMAQDFAAAFGLGEDDRHIALVDVAGVSLAAIQGLQQQLEQQRAIIEQYGVRLSEQQKTIESLRAAIEECPESDR